MSWNYRVMKKKIRGEDVFEIHEVYYTTEGKVKAWTENPIIPYGETMEELKEDILMQSRALEKPVLDYDQLTIELNENR